MNLYATGMFHHGTIHHQVHFNTKTFQHQVFSPHKTFHHGVLFTIQNFHHAVTFTTCLFYHLSILKIIFSECIHYVGYDDGKKKSLFIIYISLVYGWEWMPLYSWSTYIFTILSPYFKMCICLPIFLPILKVFLIDMIKKSITIVFLCHSKE